MSKQELRKAALAEEGYSTPSLNDQLFLHGRSFEKIENLDEYVNLRSLFLASNCISCIENIDHLVHLRSLFLQGNAIRQLSGVQHNTQLVVLNLAHNEISRVENLGTLKSLSSLDLSHNKLRTLEDVHGLLECPSLTTLDLSHNLIDDERVLSEVLVHLPNLRTLYIKGNPIVDRVDFFRRQAVLQIPTLCYIDERPVFANERRLLQAWQRGGREAEQQERTKIAAEQGMSRDEKIAARERYRARLRAIRERRQRSGLVGKAAVGGTAPDFESDSIDDNVESNDTQDSALKCDSECFDSVPEDLVAAERSKERAPTEYTRGRTKYEPLTIDDVNYEPTGIEVVTTNTSAKSDTFVPDTDGM
ncbi:MAG: hypothetical protein MHM6MM_006819 [Cercozoa sp. M6MM]